MGVYNYQNEVEKLIEDQDETGYIMQDESWKIHDLSTAVWADGLIREKEIEIGNIESIADGNIAALEAKIEKLKEWKDNSTKKYKNDITFFKEHLHLWHGKIIQAEKEVNKELVTKGKKEKKLTLTVKLPYRNLTCRSQNPTIMVNGKEVVKAKDDQEFVKYVKENNPEFIKTTEEVKWAEYKDTLKTKVIDGEMMYVDENGSPIEFIKLQKRGDKYDWNINKE